MSACCILIPVVITAWPAFSAAVVAAATSLGFSMAVETTSSSLFQEAISKLMGRDKETVHSVDLEMPNSSQVTGQLGRDQKMSVSRDGVTVTFSRDARNKVNLSVSGAGKSDEELRAIGEELSQRVIQRYVYNRVMEECKERQFVVVEESVDENQGIRLKVRQWED